MTALPPELAAFKVRLVQLLAEYPEICAAYLFGSVARGDAHTGSDLDIGLLLSKGSSPTRLDRLLGDLAARLEVETAPRALDLVVLDNQGPVFCHDVLLEGCLLYDTDFERRVDFESSTIIRALDFRPTLELATRDYLPATRRWLKEYRDQARCTAQD